MTRTLALRDVPPSRPQSARFHRRVVKQASVAEIVQAVSRVPLHTQSVRRCRAQSGPSTRLLRTGKRSGRRSTLLTATTRDV
jgi:hypothetical protein